jgi:hypothetical protein
VKKSNFLKREQARLCVEFAASRQQKRRLFQMEHTNLCKSHAPILCVEQAANFTSLAIGGPLAMIRSLLPVFMTVIPAASATTVDEVGGTAEARR